MFKNAAESMHYMERTASHATKGSRRGNVRIIGPEGRKALAEELEEHAGVAEAAKKRLLKQIKMPLTVTTMQMHLLCEMRDDFRCIGDPDAVRQLNKEIRSISRVTSFLVSQREAIKAAEGTT